MALGRRAEGRRVVSGRCALAMRGGRSRPGATESRLEWRRDARVVSSCACRRRVKASRSELGDASGRDRHLVMAGVECSGLDGGGIAQTAPVLARSRASQRRSARCWTPHLRLTLAAGITRRTAPVRGDMEANMPATGGGVKGARPRGCEERSAASTGAPLTPTTGAGTRASGAVRAQWPQVPQSGPCKGVSRWSRSPVGTSSRYDDVRDDRKSLPLDRGCDSGRGAPTGQNTEAALTTSSRAYWRQGRGRRWSRRGGGCVEGSLGRDRGGALLDARVRRVGGAARELGTERALKQGARPCAVAVAHRAAVRT